MQSFSRMDRALEFGVARLAPEPPPWVSEWLGPSVRETVAPMASGLGPMVVVRGAAFSQLTISIRDVPALADDRLEALVAAAYRALATELARQGRHPIRFWNFVPEIQAPMEAASERYMVFNAGRFRAFETWFGAIDAFRQALPTASSVGILGTDLYIHCLAADSPGQPVENPRQHPAYTYSSRYGARPPCFARATIVRPADGSARLLVGGTASVLGEETAHCDDIVLQTRETFDNLATLVSAAFDPSASPSDQPAPWRWLDRFHTLRVHVARPEHATETVRIVTAHFPRLQSAEFVQADLCRRELLVEIEGVANLSG